MDYFWVRLLLSPLTKIVVIALGKSICTSFRGKAKTYFLFETKIMREKFHEEESGFAQKCSMININNKELNALFPLRLHHSLSST